MTARGESASVRCVLRRAEFADAPQIASWLSNPKNNRYLASNLRSLSTMNAGLVNAGLRRRDQAWFIFARAGAGSVASGLLAVDSIDEIDGVANLWYVLGDQSHGGTGLTTAAIARFVADNPLNLHSVTAWLGEPNVGSARCLEKVGFKMVGRVAEAFVIDGHRSDRLIFQRLLGQT
jgi:[ribosomal protein S5]-alanine N-acetyltransferase